MSQATRILGCNALTARYVYSSIHFNPSSVFEQSLRWKRKPIWLPTAKTKVFRVPVRPVIPIEETNEIKRLYNQYRTVVKSVRKHLIKIVEENKVELDPLVVEKAKEHDFVTCSTINDEWNKKISVEREARLVEEKERKMERISLAIESYKKRKDEELKKATEEIRKAKELIPTFIMSHNIDEAIEEALRNVVDHNFAIDADGNKYTSDELDVNKKTDLPEAVVQATQ